MAMTRQCQSWRRASAKAKTGRLWAYVRDERPHGGQRPPAAVYFYSPDRKGEHPQAHLKSFKGVLHADGYAGFNAVFETGVVTEAACWAHARRKFFDVHAANGSPIAHQALDRIGALYGIEATIRGQAARCAAATPRAAIIAVARRPQGMARNHLAETLGQIGSGCCHALCAEPLGCLEPPCQ